MPLQNRVTPFSTLIDSPARGTLMGNRGCLHDAQKRIRRLSQGKRWIICLLDFKDRKRPVMSPGLYTELFFLDEATALAAGHRPCAECQRVRFNLFREACARANPGMSSTPRPSAVDVDAVLHRERMAPGTADRFRTSIDGLPDGTFITDDEENAYLVFQRRLWRWREDGYDRSPVPSIGHSLRVMTPPSVVRTLAAGYPSGIHPSASLIAAR